MYAPQLQVSTVYAHVSIASCLWHAGCFLVVPSSCVERNDAAGYGRGVECKGGGCSSRTDGKLKQWVMF